VPDRIGLLDLLASTPAPEWDLAPPHEVRRRGDARRRHRWIGAGGVSLLAALYVPFVVAPLATTSGVAARAPGAVDASTPGAWTTSVPADFSLGDDVLATAPATSKDLGVLAGVRGCATAPVAALATIAVSAPSRSSGDPGEGRTLLVYRDAATADVAVREVRVGLETCVDVEPVAPGSEAPTRPDDAWAYVGSGARPPGARPADTGTVVVRFGNAVLVDRLASEGAVVPVARLDLLALSSREAIAGMCVFAAEPCEGSTSRTAGPR
jgi:hypothetical protein